jgi:hypothetical protein
VKQQLVRWKQKPPYNYNLPLLTSVYETLAGPADASTWAQTPEGFGTFTRATNEAKRKFVDKLGESSQLGSTLTAELKASWGTVVSGVVTALQASKAVLRGNLVEAGKLLGFAPPVIRKTVVRSSRTKSGKVRYRRVTNEYWRMPDTREVLKSAGNKWLWYSYGVKPLTQDIYNAMDVLTREVPAAKVVGYGSATDAWTPGGYLSTSWNCKVTVRIQAHVRVTNPNLWLANQLGLINPAQWFLEGVRLSFVLDWFSNLSQIVNQLTEFAGISIERPVTTSKTTQELRETVPSIIPWKEHRRGTTVRRELVMPQAKLVVAYERFNWQRGANAISLLVGGLRNVSPGTHARSSF